MTMWDTVIMQCVTTEFELIASKAIKNSHLHIVGDVRPVSYISMETTIWDQMTCLITQGKGELCVTPWGPHATQFPFEEAPDNPFHRKCFIND